MEHWGFEEYREKMSAAVGDEEKQEVFAEAAGRILNTRTSTEDTIIEMMKIELVSCDYQEKSITLRFPVLPWQINPIGTLHGGLSATAADDAGGLLTQLLTMTKITPTVYLNTSYLSPVMMGDCLVVKAKVERQGKRLIHVHMQGWAESTGEMAIAAMGAFMAIEK